MKHLLNALLAAALLGAPPATAGDAPRPAQWQPDGIEVDVELVLAVDVSRSVSPNELEIQRRGYAEAITSPEVLEAVRNGLLGRIAVTYMEWAGTWAQRTVVDWTVIETEDDARAFAAALTARFDPTLRRTSISAALLSAAEAFEDNGYDGLRQVIDISGDGPNNEGLPVLEARDTVLARGIVINGLPLMTREGMGSQWHLDNLDIYYQTCVVGGPGSFVIPVTEWEDFSAAVRRKLILEIASAPSGATLVPAQTPARDPRDCMVGEKIWNQRSGYWGMP